jgi:predicted flap endonuclease-1-like 5' DNA nuclease
VPVVLLTPLAWRLAGFLTRKAGNRMTVSRGGGQQAEGEMDILWLVIGFIIGLLVAWFYLNARYKNQVAEREAELLQNGRQTEEALERERDAHNTTKQRISELETQHALEREQTASLTAELKTSQENLEQAEAAGGENRDLQERLRQREADIKRLESDLAECRAKAVRATNAPAAAATGGTTPAYAATAPAGGAADDLTKIKGIGQVLKGKLNGLGITTFRQIAEFTEADIERVNTELDFPGRIERERWVEQARDFMRQ